MNPNSTDELFAIIRKELNVIVENGNKKCETIKGKTEPKIGIDKEKPETQIKSNLEQNIKSLRTKASGVDQNRRTSNVNQQIVRIEAGGTSVSEETDEMSLELPGTTEDNETKLITMKKRFESTLERDIAHQTAFLNSPRTKNIDADIQRMQMELQDSYNLFQAISEKFEAINFSRLQKHIKELNLSSKRDVVGTNRAEELKTVVDEGFKTNRLKEMTNKVGEKFSKHPGEFGNIPELSSFFQACTQLEHVLSNLKRQRSDVRDLEERMRKSAEISYNRVNYIKNQLLEKKLEDQSLLQNDIDN